MGRALWDRYKTALGLSDFGDLIERRLLDVAVAPKSPHAILTDEAQDLTLMQATLIRKWGERQLLRQRR